MNWKRMELESDNYNNRDWCFWYIHQRIIKGISYYIVENGQNTEKSTGNLQWLAVTQTPVKDYQLTLM